MIDPADRSFGTTPHEMTSGNEGFLSQRVAFKNLRTVLAKSHVDVVRGGEIRERFPKNGHMAGQAEVPVIQIYTTAIEMAIPSL